jgi:hypothetical protein
MGALEKEEEGKGRVRGRRREQSFAKGVAKT